MRKVTITQQGKYHTMTTSNVQGGDVISTRSQTYKAAYRERKPRGKLTGEALEQARARCEHMRQVVQERKRNGT